MFFAKEHIIAISIIGSLVTGLFAYLLGSRSSTSLLSHLYSVFNSPKEDVCVANKLVLLAAKALFFVDFDKPLKLARSYKAS